MKLRTDGEVTRAASDTRTTRMLKQQHDKAAASLRATSSKIQDNGDDMTKQFNKTRTRDGIQEESTCER